MTDDYVAKGLEVNGIVQGVGFRPFVYQLAKRYGIKGEVLNTASGVSIHIEGADADIESFCTDLEAKSPPLAYIADIQIRTEIIKGFSDFFIAESRGDASVTTLISPDVSVCDDCLKELYDENDRRFRYPFINCTNCGPRYTIIETIPYDRPFTSMKSFTMCDACQAEYDDPNNRRFHAQPNACPVCGPRVCLCDNGGCEIPVEDPIVKTVELLKKGHILAIKGLGGFHLAVDAQNDEAVRRLRKRKRREEKPFALMAYDLSRIRQFAVVEPDEEALMRTPQRPIVLLKKRLHHSISTDVSPRNNYFGVMLPYTPLHYLLLESFTALVMTSGNMSEEPIAIDNEDAQKRLGEIADYLLFHDRNIILRSDDSIVRHLKGATRFIRRSRGFVPAPVFLNKKVPSTLACGAELKNTICLVKDDKAFLSQHIGDMENLSTFEFFALTVEHIKRILDIEPEIVACDLHPDYMSTGYALEQNDIPVTAVQHHHAHIVSCMAENKVSDPVIGLSFDGTGYGTDGNIWGCEILVADEKGFERAAHLSYVPMPGGALAIKQPWRMALSYLHETFGDNLPDLTIIKQIDEKTIGIVLEMMRKEVNSPLTSSLGRLFDGVASLIGIRTHVRHEGQAAMELEMAAGFKTGKHYDYGWGSGDTKIMEIKPIIRGITADILNGVAPGIVAVKFHETLISMFSSICNEIGKETGINRAALSGGVFQNGLLLSGMVEALSAIGFDVLTHKMVPCNDGGISLGQALAAAARK